jgi:hypothetical protein
MPLFDLNSVKVAIAYRSTRDSTSSHQGLGVCAVNTMKTLIQHHIKATMIPVISSQEIDDFIVKNPDVTHLVIQAPWVPLIELQTLAFNHQNVQFSVTCHSNVGFLQTEPEAITKMIDLLGLEQSSHNVHAAGNSVEFCNWIKDSYQSMCTYLPNLYYLDEMALTQRPLWDGGVLRIGIFGAPRAQKNVMTGVAGAIGIAQSLKAHTEIWLNSNRDERDGKTIREAAKRAIERNPFCVYKEFAWAPWPAFRRFIGSMNLLIQASHTESFNQVTADGVATGVPTVTSRAIRWVPDYWKADSDSAGDITIKGITLLKHANASRDGLMNLHDHNRLGIMAWKRYLSGSGFLNNNPY